MTIEYSAAAISGPKPTGGTVRQGARALARLAPGADATSSADAGFATILGAQEDAPADASALATARAQALPALAAADVSSLLQSNPQIAAAQAQPAAPEAARARAAVAPDSASLAQSAVPVAVGKTATGVVPCEAAESPALALTQGLQAQPTSAAGGATDSNSVALGNQRGGPNPFLAAMEQARMPASARGPEPRLAPLQATPQGPQVERSAPRQDIADLRHGGSTLAVGAPDFSPLGTATPVLAPQMQVAEQVRYWVSQNVQSAELTLDGLGLSAVQVSISMQGNEAHISFRTDEAATREVLQNAGAHLKDLLQGEGLVLTGVSVDSSGAGQSDRGARRGRPAVRLVTLAPAPAAGTGSAPRLRTANPGGAGRSVDLFV